MRKGERKGIMEGVPEWRTQGGFGCSIVQLINHKLSELWQTVRAPL